MSGPSSAWRLSSVQWLRQNYASLEYVGRGLSAPGALALLLKKIGYLDNEFNEARKSGEAPAESSLDDWIAGRIHGWSEEDHKGMIAWQKSAATRAVAKALDDKIRGREITGAWMDEADELIKGDHPDMEPIPVVENGKKSRKPRSGKSTTKELEADELEDAVTYGSPVAGSW